MRSETWTDGRLVELVENHNDGTATRTTYGPDGTVTSTETITGLPIVPPFPPLDATGALATLLVVDGVVALQDAANAIGEEPAHLVHEAQAWGVG